MIYSDSNRLEYPTCKVVETETFIVINGITYDKKTLQKINTKTLEVGFNNITKLNKAILPNISCEAEYAVQASYKGILSTIHEDEIPVGKCSVVDNKNSNLEWTFAGESLIEFDLEHNTFKTRVLDFFNTSSNKQALYNCFVLHQDDSYIYLFAQYTNESTGPTALNYKGLIFNKSTYEIKESSPDISLSGSYAGNAFILKKDQGTVIVFTNFLGTMNIHKLACAAGNITVTKLSASSVIKQFGSYTCSVPSKFSTEGKFYLLEQGPKINYCKYENDAFTIEGTEELFTSEKVDVKTFLMKKYKISEEDWDTKKAEYFKFSETIFDSYKDARIYTMGENGEFLVVVYSGYGVWGDRNTATSLKDNIIAVFQKTEPDSDPLKLSLVDYYSYDEILPTTGSLAGIFKLNNLTLFQPLQYGIRKYVVGKDGKLEYMDYYNPNIKYFGFDSYNRLYVVNKVNRDLEIFTDQLPYKINIDFENSGDAFISYSDSPVTKNIKVKTVNCFNKPVIGSFELSCNGKAEFTNTSSSFYRGATNKSGEATVGIKIKAPTESTVGMKLIYNNELAYTAEDGGEE